MAVTAPEMHGIAQLEAMGPVNKNVLIPTPDQQRVKGFADKVNTGNVEEGLNEVVTGLPKGWEKKIEKMMKTDVDPVTGERKGKPAAVMGGKSEDARAADVIAQMKKYDNFLRNGYDALPPAEQGFMRAEVIRFINSRPMLKKAYTNPTTMMIDPEYIEGILRYDAEFKQELTNNQATVMKEVDAVESKLFTEQQNVDKLEAQKNLSADKKKKATDRLATTGDIGKDMNDFQTDTITVPLTGSTLPTTETKHTMRDSLNKDTDPSLGDYRNKFNERAKLRRDLAAKPNGRDPALESQIKTLDINMTAAKGAVTVDTKTRIQTWENLTNEWNNIQGERQGAQDIIDNADREIASLTKPLAEAKKKLNDVNVERVTVGEQLEGDTEQAILKAGQESVVKRIRSRKTEYATHKQQELTKEAEGKTAQEESEQQKRKDDFEKKLAARWDKKVKNRRGLFGRHKEDIIVLDKEAALKDKALLLDSSKGVDAIIEAALDKAYPPGTPANDEARKALMADKVYMTKISGDIPAQVLGVCTATGVEFNDNELYAMALNPKVGPVLDAWLAKNTKAQEFIKGAHKEGLHGKKASGKFSEFLKDHGGAMTILLLLIALGVIMITKATGH